MSDKDKDAFRTIGEVAEELDLPQHVLRFWETRFSQIRPLKRGGGRRFYRPEDLELLRAIRHLLYSRGFTIRGVQRLLKEHGVRAVAETVRPGTGGEATLSMARQGPAPWSAPPAPEDAQEDAADDSDAPAEASFERRVVERREPRLPEPSQRTPEAPPAVPETGRPQAPVVAPEPAPARPAAKAEAAAPTPSQSMPAPAPAVARRALSPAARAGLEDVLIDLLECKRRLDALV